MDLVRSSVAARPEGQAATKTHTNRLEILFDVVTKSAQVCDSKVCSDDIVGTDFDLLAGTRVHALEVDAFVGHTNYVDVVDRECTIEARDNAICNFAGIWGSHL